MVTLLAVLRVKKQQQSASLPMKTTNKIINSFCVENVATWWIISEEEPLQFHFVHGRSSRRSTIRRYDDATQPQRGCGAT